MPSLDTIDRKILAHLQTDGRMTMQELADKVGLSLPARGACASWRSRGSLSDM